MKRYAATATMWKTSDTDAGGISSRRENICVYFRFQIFIFAATEGFRFVS